MRKKTNYWEQPISSFVNFDLGDDEYEEEVEEVVTKTTPTGFSFSEVVNWLKNVDLDGLQQGIGNVQRVLGVVQDFTKKDKVYW